MTSNFLSALLMIGVGTLGVQAACPASQKDFTHFQKEGVARRSVSTTLPSERTMPQNALSSKSTINNKETMPIGIDAPLKVADSKSQEKMDSVIRMSISDFPISRQLFSYTSTGQCLRADNYLPGQDGEWMLYTYFNYEYDSLGRLIMKEQVNPSDESQNMRYEYGYDNDSDLYAWEIFYYPDWETLELMPSQKGEYQYDSEGRPIDQTFFYWDNVSNNWMVYGRETVSFDSLGRQTSYFKYVPNEDRTALVGEDGEEYIYVGDTETDAEVDGFVWENGEWLKYMRHIYTYENGKLMKNEFLYWNRAQQDWSGNDTFGPYEILQRNVYTDYSYDEEGRLVKEAAYNMTQDGEYINTMIDNYSYTSLENGVTERIREQQLRWQGPYLSDFKKEIQRFNVFGAELYYKNFTYVDGQERATSEEIRDIDDHNIYHGGVFYGFINDEANTRYGASKEEFGYPADWDGVNETPSYGKHWKGAGTDTDNEWIEDTLDEFVWHDIYLIGNTHYYWENYIQYRQSSYLYTCDYDMMADDIWAWPSTRENVPYKILELEQCYDLDGDGEWDDYGYYSSYVDHYYYSGVVNTGIGSINETTGALEVERFDLSGRRLSTPVMGINIVKYSDGSVKKVLVK